MLNLGRVVLLLACCVPWACVHRSRVPAQATADCPLVREADAVRTDSIPLARITGRSRLVLIDTVNRQRAPESLYVTLRAPDSTYLVMLAEGFRRATGVGYARPPKGPPLVEFEAGHANWRADWRGMTSGACFPVRCMDESATTFKFRYLGARSVRGVWSNPMAGIGILVDPKTQRPLRPPAGIFCMMPA